MTPRHLDRLIAATLFVAYVAVLVSTSGSLGYARDEGFYFYAADAYRGWFELLSSDPAAAFERKNIDRFFSINREHPPLMKIGFLFSHAVFFELVPLFREPGTAHRFAGMLVSALGVAVVYLWGSRAFGRLGGLVGALSLAFMPRVFYHAHLACFDLPVASLLVATAYAYSRSLETRRFGWLIATGLFYGLALGTKHNAWLFPFALVAHLLVLRAKHWMRAGFGSVSSIPPGLFAMAVLGPVVLYAGWPWIWFDTFERLSEYVRFHTQHDYYNMEFLGRTYWKPPMPRAYAWLMTLGTVPLVTLVLAAVGVYALARGAIDQRAGRTPPETPAFHSLTGPVPTELLWLLLVLVNYAPWWSAETPIFGGTKHWIGAYPFLCLLAGRGFSIVVEKLRGSGLGPVGKRGGPALVAAAALLGPLVMTARSHPWGLSFYTPLVGGAVGAADLGLNRTFWGYTTGAVAPVLNERAPRAARVYLHDTAVPSWDMLQRDGRVRRDLRGTLSIADSRAGLYHHEPHMGRVEYQLWMEYGTATPVHVATYDGVPVIWLYERQPIDSRGAR